MFISRLLAGCKFLSTFNSCRMLVNRVSSTLLSTAGAAGTGPGRLAIAVVGMQSGVLSGILLLSLHYSMSVLYLIALKCYCHLYYII